jgi:membrane protein YqaA with SNARE-associated domain
MLHWADTRYGSVALFMLSFAESSFFPIPPDALLIALVLGARAKAFKFALNCTLASVCGAILGYAIGYYVWWGTGDTFSPVAQFFFNVIPGFNEKLFYDIKTLYDRYDFWIVFTAGFTPIPYKLFTVSGGAFQINFVMFIMASLVSRSARFFLVAFLLWKFGEPIRNFIDRYFDRLAILFTILLIGGFGAVKFFL